MLLQLPSELFRATIMTSPQHRHVGTFTSRADPNSQRRMAQTYSLNPSLMSSSSSVVVGLLRPGVVLAIPSPFSPCAALDAAPPAITFFVVVLSPGLVLKDVCFVSATTLRKMYDGLVERNEKSSIRLRVVQTGRWENAHISVLGDVMGGMIVSCYWHSPHPPHYPQFLLVFVQLSENPG